MELPEDSLQLCRELRRKCSPCPPSSGTVARHPSGRQLRAASQSRHAPTASSFVSVLLENEGFQWKMKKYPLFWFCV